ncbi:MAG: DUF2085 domain-containing protein [Chloroflexi bacterium]|nr:DUF2085 domain-containing protein [Chloroflexota bacterium]MBP7045271.1 DUF2085 domain-containing protein [Chloroflexota bacterium]
MTTPSPKTPVTGRQRSMVISIDKFIYKFSRHWLAFFNILIAIYVGLPMLAPVLMEAGLTRPAGAIYTLYSPMCHQMASRSFFLFGDQPAYPRAIAGTDLTPIEAYMPTLPEFAGASTDPSQWMTFLLAARRFTGNEQMGYKMALCERDIGIYSFVLLGGLLYGLLRKRYHIKALPLWAFLIVGMGPIALDGFSQLFSQYGTASPALSFFNTIFPLRESTPFMRSLTGAIFGLSLVWLAYPHVDEGMKITAADLEAKLTRIGELNPGEET